MYTLQKKETESIQFFLFIPPLLLLSCIIFLLCTRCLFYSYSSKNFAIKIFSSTIYPFAVYDGFIASRTFFLKYRLQKIEKRFIFCSFFFFQGYLCNRYVRLINLSLENVESIIFRTNNQMLKIIKILLEFERPCFLFNFYEVNSQFNFKSIK